MPSKPPTTRQKYGPASKDERPSAWRRGYDKRHNNWRQLVLNRDNYVCQICGRPGNHADHIVPLRKGGDWSLENGQALCHSCHSCKTQGEMG